MDQYIIDLKLSILYFDLLELIMLIEDSKNEELLPHAEKMRKTFDEHSG